MSRKMPGKKDTVSVVTADGPPKMVTAVQLEGSICTIQDA